jgi:hypothetical protein
MTSSSRAPVVGFAVKMTPETSAGTNSWTTIPIANARWSIPIRWR